MGRRRQIIQRASIALHSRRKERTMDSPSTRQPPGRTLLILGFGTLAFVLAQTTVIPALGDLQRVFGASASGIAWMITAYLLVASIATPILGRLGDMFGKQRLLAISLALFAVGSVVCALADSLPLMIVGRGLQGLGGGVFPLSFGIIRDEFPKHKVPTGIALLGAIAAIGSSIGLPLGGVLVDQANYHWIFWVAATMGVLATLTTHLFVPASPVRTPGRVDLKGAAILGISLTALLIGISRAADSVGLVILWSCITSAGVGAAFAAIPNLIVGAVDKHETGEATGVNTVMRNIGSAVGAQVAGTIIATHVLASGLTANTGFTIAFLVSAIGAVIAGLSVLLIPGRCQQSAAEPDLQPALAA